MAPKKRSQTTRPPGVAEASSPILPTYETDTFLSYSSARGRRHQPREDIRAASSALSPAQDTDALRSPIIPDSPLSPGVRTPDSISRRESTSTMRTSSIPFEGPPTCTPSGRISKAKKGKRVHACEFPGCGKVFTRAEHRRRHELNHNPEAMFPCTRPGCHKAFHRVDLLQRHQEKHDLESATDASAATMSEFSQRSVPSEMPSSVHPAPPMTSPQAGRSTPNPSSGGLSIGSLVNPQGDYRYSLGTPAFNGFGRQAMHFVPGFNSSDESIFYTPESSQSPVSDYYGRYRNRQSISSSSSIAAFDTNGASPLIGGNIPSPWVPSSAPPPSMLPSNMLDEAVYFPVCPPFHWFGMCTEADQSPADSSLPIPLSDLDGYEWSVIRRELSHAPGLLPRDASTGLPDTIRWHCLDYYWQYFHPHFPVVHRPTFLPTKPSPLLASAMAAIGSQYDDRPDAKLYSLTLLEIATKLLRRRHSITSRSRLADLQTVFLLEVLSKYCARRVEVDMSARFRSLFASLDQARRTLATDALAVFRTLPKDRTADDVTRAHKFWLEHETRRRILQASTVLDLQQVTLFEQPATIVQHERPRRPSLDLRYKVPLPCPRELWETSPIETWLEAASKNDMSKQPNTGNAADFPADWPHDFFQVQVGVATNPELSYGQFLPQKDQLPGDSAARLAFNYHLHEMARHTPIRQLLVVSGESWVLGKKLESEAEFQTAKRNLRAWIDANRESRISLWHATQLIRSRAQFIVSDSANTDLAVSFLDTHMLHEPWGLYLAVLVCWAYGLTASVMLETMGGQVSGAGSTSVSEANSHLSSRSSSSSRSLPSTLPTLLDLHEATYSMREYLQRTNVETPDHLLRLDARVFGQIHGLLEMVRVNKIGHLLGGLMNEAERVLYRLVEGRGRLSNF
ncbi:hypothetical protein A1O1_00830 [Capronia coronata CBS 617.96]|uniref:C2H2-type domain-containing protein n=1 Tax=Capronia coronata CBS 617.96 TaxID=1182541 RepID=W9YS23_9EURO|nr:uncharacterized protein A1O1_00830 [Capronia coronata CBS 617.96]EXJ95707.1 hypothetical protein A1O1_00830 [Capronia coronata CBS 617.96]